MIEIKENNLRSLLMVIDKELLCEGRIFKIVDFKYHSSDITKKSFLKSNKTEKAYYVDSFKIIFFNETENYFERGNGNFDWLERLLFLYNLNYLRKDYIIHKNLFDKYDEFCNKNQ